FCVPVCSSFSGRFGVKRGKSGGSSPFYQLKKGAATTPRNVLFMVVLEERVVAVAAVLQNSVVGSLGQVHPVCTGFSGYVCHFHGWMLIESAAETMNRHPIRQRK
ncbi:MAG: hypothetical protein K2P62_03665, partial [Phocaeicola sp.]|nr:hypothetical protein [Phocaeicola sp.]